MRDLSSKAGTLFSLVFLAVVLGAHTSGRQDAGRSLDALGQFLSDKGAVVGRWIVKLASGALTGQGTDMAALAAAAIICLALACTACICVGKIGAHARSQAN